MIIDGITDTQGTGLKDGIVESADMVAGRFGGDYVKLTHTEPQGGVGGGSVSGWNDIIINTKDIDTAGICTLASNDFTLPAGTYDFDSSFPGYRVDRHKARLYNVTDAAIQIEGTAEFSYQLTDSIPTKSLVQGLFTINDTKTFRINHYTFLSKSTNAFGVNCDQGPEVFATIIIRKVA